VVDKRGVLNSVTGAKLDLGCGCRKRGSDYIGIDLVDHEAVDVVGDVFDVLALIPDSSVSSVFSSHFMEHIEDIGKLIKELGRVIAAGGSLETVVPHFSNPYFYSDATHRTAFGLYSMSYFVGHSPFKREVPLYAHPPLFDLIAVNLIFKSPRPFYGRHAIHKLTQPIVNLSRATQEFYEEIISPWLPCYELQFLMTRVERMSGEVEPDSTVSAR
jgi:ubiquinone/menaquinone biosynthesis C-methylase UbiE